MRRRLFWGGPSGARPVFVVTADGGRGKGKSKLCEMLARLVGGALSFSHNEDINVIKTRLLSKEGRLRRVAFLDNVKSLKFSWAELEAIVTAPIISGKQLYVGEGTRPNSLTWFITLNGAALSTDMAQRSVIIKLGEPARSGDWEDDLTAYIRMHYDAIVADIITCLKSPAVHLDNVSRWALWDSEIVARLMEPAEAQAIIRERQEAVDVEQTEAEDVQDFLAEKLAAIGHYDVQFDRILIPSQIAAAFYNEATGERRNIVAVGKIMKQFCDEGKMPRLEYNRNNALGRGFIWNGEHSDHTTKLQNNLKLMLGVSQNNPHYFDS